MQTKIAPEIQKVIEHRSDPAERVTERLAIGKTVHQGDVYLHRVAADHPRGVERGSRQVAVGTTVGQLRRTGRRVLPRLPYHRYDPIERSPGCIRK